MRLTLKVNNEYITDDTKCMKNKYITKLGSLEDIEEELGIDLDVLFKALKRGYVFIKTSQYKQVISYVSWVKHYIQIRHSNHIQLKMKDYGKTWALTKEELE